MSTDYLAMLHTNQLMENCGESTFSQISFHLVNQQLIWSFQMYKISYHSWLRSQNYFCDFPIEPLCTSDRAQIALYLWELLALS